MSLFQYPQNKLPVLWKLLLNFDWIKKSHRVTHESQRLGELCYCCQEAFFIEGSQLTKFCLSRNPYKIGLQQGYKSLPTKPWFSGISDKSTDSAVADEKYFNHYFISPCFAPECPVLRGFPGLLWYALKLQIVANQSRTLQVVTTC